MNATLTVSIRIPAATARLIKKAAKARGLKLATWIREAAALAAEDNPGLGRAQEFQLNDRIIRAYEQWPR